MDKPWIKGVLIGAFVITLLIVFITSIWALVEVPPMKLNVSAPVAPVLTQKPALPTNATPEAVDAYLTRMSKANDIDKVAVQTYATQVTAFTTDVNARITATKAATRDAAQRLDAYDKVVKNSLCTIILTPLLAALILYSGIKVGGDVAASRALNTQTKISAP
jgi:outer membrane murein-binding lipoprotein Lpp